jgi:integrase/recombinase XerD
MLTDCFVDTHALERLRHGVAGAYLDDFTDWLASRSYAKPTIRSYVAAAVRFLTWAHAAGYEVSTLDPASLARYRAYLSATNGAGKHAHEGSNAYCGARRLIVFLRQRGLAPAVRPVEPPLVAAFCAWMRQHRGVTEITLDGYARVLRQLLQALGAEPQCYTAAQLRAFVLAQSQGYSHSKAETVVTAVRLFVRFLIATERCAGGLQYAIPRLAGWRQATLPRYLEPAAVERIIVGCDPSTPLGARDRAVLLLLARLALRASDVAGLRLGDLDWQHGRLWVSGKTRRAAWVPLPQEVGEAILHYLKTGRPAVAGEGLFLIAHAPYTPILARQVCQSAERAIRRAGIEAPSYGAHLFRHSAATTLLRQGLSLQSIGTLLRHHDVDTTALYAKVDVELLRQIALPWPQEVTPC